MEFSLQRVCMLRVYGVWAHHHYNTDYHYDFHVIYLRSSCWDMSLLHHCELSGTNKFKQPIKQMLLLKSASNQLILGGGMEVK